MIHTTQAVTQRSQPPFTSFTARTATKNGVRPLSPPAPAAEQKSKPVSRWGQKKKRPAATDRLTDMLYIPKTYINSIAYPQEKSNRKIPKSTKNKGKGSPLTTC